METNHHLRGTQEDDIGGVTPTVTLARLYEKQGFLDKAAAVYRKLIASEPDRADLRESLESIERGLRSRRRPPEESKGTTILSELTKWAKVIHGKRQTLDKGHKKERRLLVIYGPGLDTYEDDVKSRSTHETWKEIESQIKSTAEDCCASVETFQSDHEEALVQKIRESSTDHDVLIINPGESVSTSEAIRDALMQVDIPIIEVYASNTCAQGTSTSIQKPLMADLATAHLAGFGKDGYMMAVRAAAKMITKEGQ